MREQTSKTSCVTNPQIISPHTHTHTRRGSLAAALQLSLKSESSRLTNILLHWQLLCQSHVWLLHHSSTADEKKCM